jgi:hypothetical protein
MPVLDGPGAPALADALAHPIAASRPAKSAYKRPTQVSARPVTRPDRKARQSTETAAAVTAAASRSGGSSSQGVNRTAKAVGTVAWIIMAPLMFASARRSFPCLTHMTAFRISGSSVATGLRKSAVT